MQERVRSPNYRRRKKPAITLPVLREFKVIDPPIGVIETPDIIDNPLGETDLAERRLAVRRDGTRSETGEGEWTTPALEKIIVIRSTKHDPLGWMHSNGHVDESEYRAARQWQLITELSNLGGVGSIDTTKEAVDGGMFPDALTDGQQAAIQQLRLAKLALVASVPEDRNRGALRILLLDGVLVDNEPIRSLAGIFRIERHRLGREFTAALRVLAIEFGLRGEAPTASKGKIVGWRSAASQRES